MRSATEARARARAHTHTHTHTHKHISHEVIIILTESALQFIRKQQIIHIVINGGLSCLEGYQLLYLRLTNHNYTLYDMDIEEDN